GVSAHCAPHGLRPGTRHKHMEGTARRVGGERGRRLRLCWRTSLSANPDQDAGQAFTGTALEAALRLTVAEAVDQVAGRPAFEAIADSGAGARLDPPRPARRGRVARRLTRAVGSRDRASTLAHAD